MQGKNIDTSLIPEKPWVAVLRQQIMSMVNYYGYDNAKAHIDHLVKGIVKNNLLINYLFENKL